MFDAFTVLAMIPARGGSKGVIRKNVRLLGGKPLLAHSVLTARQSRYIDRIIVSTDDKAMRRVALDWGAQAPFLRPAALGQDKVMDYPVLEHCLNWLREREGYEPDVIVYLWPTGALRQADDIDDAIALLAKNPDADSVRSVHEAVKSPYKMWELGERFMTPLMRLKGVKDFHHAPRQTLPKVYQSNPYACVLWRRTLRKKKSLLGDKVLPFIIERPVVDLDTEADFALAGWMLERQSGRS